MNKKKQIISFVILGLLLILPVLFLGAIPPIDDAAVSPDTGDVAYVICDAGDANVKAFDRAGTLLFEKTLHFKSGGTAAVFYEEDHLCVHDVRDDTTYVYDRNGVWLETRENDHDAPGVWEDWDMAWTVYQVTVGETRYVYDKANFFEMIFGEKTILFIENEQGEKMILWEP